MSGPVDLWFECAVPGAGAAPTLHTDGTPESVANPNAEHAGMLKSGGGMTITAEIQERTSDNLSAPYDTRLLTSQASLKGDMLQFSAVLLGLITPGATVDGTPPAGKTGITLGSIANVNYTCVLGVWEQKTSGKYFNAVLYNAYQANGFDLALNRNEDSAAEVDFKAVAVGSRATEDQVAALWIDD
jgi:hypothetical protein